MTYSAHIYLIKNFSLNHNNLILNINDETLLFEDYQGPNFKSGRFCIVGYNFKKRPISLYLLDNNDVPFQIFGNIDIFNESYELVDSSKEYKKYYDYAKQLCIFAFSKLTIAEIESNKEDLLFIENLIYQNVLNENFGWKKNKKLVFQLLNNCNLSLEIKNKMLSNIEIAPLPKKALQKPFKINLIDYYVN